MPQSKSVCSPFPRLYSVCISFHDSLINSLGSAEGPRPANGKSVRVTSRIRKSACGYKGVATQLLIQQLVHCTIDSAIDTYTALSMQAHIRAVKKIVTEYE